MLRCWSDEKGMALPLVTAISIVIFLFLFTTLSHTVYSRESASIEWDMMRAQYAAESGIAALQHRLRVQPDWRGTVQITINDAKVVTKTEGNDHKGIHVTSIGFMDRGVKQSVRVVLDPVTYEIREWSR